MLLIMGFSKPKTSKKKSMAAKKINETKENFCAAPLCKSAERKAIPKSSLLEDIYLFR